MPVLAIGGAESVGEGAANTMRLTADDVQGAVLPGAGHWVAEQAPDTLVTALSDFLAPYRRVHQRACRRIDALMTMFRLMAVSRVCAR